MRKRLYYHRTDGGAEYLTDRCILCADGSKEGVFEDAQIIVRIDGDIREGAELMMVQSIWDDLTIILSEAVGELSVQEVDLHKRDISGARERRLKANERIEAAMTLISSMRDQGEAGC